MVYILIVLWASYGSSTAGRAALSIEFNSMEACQAAAKEIRKQSDEYEKKVGTLICAAKG